MSSTRGNSRRLVSFSAAASPQGKDRLSLSGRKHALNSGCRLRVAGWRRGIGGLGFEWSSYMPRSLRTCLIRYLETGTRRLTGEFCLVEPGFTPKQATSEYRSSPLFLSGGKIASFPLPRRKNVRKVRSMRTRLLRTPFDTHMILSVVPSLVNNRSDPQYQ